MAFKILLGTDGSKYSKKAADYCIDLAKKLNAEVLAVYVMSMKHLEVYALKHHDDITGYEDENVLMSREAKDAVGYAAARAKSQGVHLETRIVRGYPADELIRLAGDEGFDILVVGNLGKSGVERMLMGSVSETVVRQAPCPVLVVRGK